MICTVTAFATILNIGKFLFLFFFGIMIKNLCRKKI